MGYQREREEFLMRMGRIGMDAASARLILRHAQTYHRLSERECNGDDWCEGDTDRAKRWGYLVLCPLKGKLACTCGKEASEPTHHYVTRSSVRMAQLEKRINEVVSRAAGECKVGFQGDPRGYEVTIYVGGAHGPQIGVPRKEAKTHA